MKTPLRQLIRQQDADGLARYCRETFQASLTEQQARAILDHARSVGGTADQPWSDSTWKMWLKGRAQQTPSAVPTEAEIDHVPRRTLAELLNELADPILSADGLEVCCLGRLDEAYEYPDAAWEELFPTVLTLDDVLAKEFEARGGRAFLGPAPLASWLLARLQHLKLGGVEEENDLGGYQTEFLLRAAGTPIGFVNLVADSGAIELDLSGRTSQVGRDFIALLVHDIKAVDRCELVVHGAELDCTNSYGWSGEYFLGAWNVRE